MNVYRVYLKVKKDVFCKTTLYIERDKYLWVISTSLPNAVIYVEKLLKTEYADYCFEDVQFMGEARIHHNEDKDTR